MPRAGAYLLSDVKTEKLEMVCDLCQRRGVFSVAGLAKRYRPDTNLPGLLMTIARSAGCKKALDPTGLEQCKAKYANLIWKLP